ncbi:MAG: hypothetical protein JWM85_3349 [Acidimicrobiaceae bacterium]|nr:hypothetical protein [Acidimicrobiaceae bacterium]
MSSSRDLQPSPRARSTYLDPPCPSTEPPLGTFSISCDRADSSIVHMPAPRAALRHAVPVIAEGLLAPVALFYLTLVFTGFRGALVAALAWSYLAAGRRLLRGERISTVLALDVVLLSVRTAVSFVTHSAFLYFAQPLVGTVIIAMVLIVSAIIGRPFAQRFAHDFCPLDPQLLVQPKVRQFFIRISLMWAIVLLLNSGLLAWLLVSSSLRNFVLERTAITWGLTASAIFCSIYGFVLTMRRDGCTVRWGARIADPVPQG